jgi:hypothetical protein
VYAAVLAWRAQHLLIFSSYHGATDRPSMPFCNLNERSILMVRLWLILLIGVFGLVGVGCEAEVGDPGPNGIEVDLD